jgi:hypothetical protein
VTALFAMALRAAILPMVTCDMVIAMVRKDRCQLLEPHRKRSRQMDSWRLS